MTGQIDIRPLTTRHLALGLALSTSVEWNQTERDWQRLLDWQPDGCFVGVLDGCEVGTVTTCRFGRIAWIGLLLVEKRVRGRGVGRALLQHAISWLEAQGATSLRLDATPLGQPLYECLGFVADFGLVRYAGRPFDSALVRATRAGVTSDSPWPGDWTEMAALDQQATGAARYELLVRLDALDPGAPRVVRRDGHVVGFRLAREGRLAWQLGPCCADSRHAEVGASLLADGLHAMRLLPVFVDVPEEHFQARRLVESAGLVVQRRLLRMTRGPKVAERPECLWASFGPEKG